MATWANQESAAECLKKAAELLTDFDTAGATKFVEKSLRLFESDEGMAMRRRVEERAAHEAMCDRVLRAPDLFAVLEVDHIAQMGYHPLRPLTKRP